MSEEYGNNFVVLTDENGKEIELEHLDTVEYNGQTYMAFIPAEMNVEDAYELIIMKVEEEDGECLVVTGQSSYRSVNIQTLPYPGFPTDMHPQFAPLLCLANGVSCIQEGVWENRFRYVNELRKMGATVVLDSRTATFVGGGPLHGAPVDAMDLRAGAALIIAGLVAEGKTEIGGVDYIYRGYDHIVQKLAGLGACIQEIPVSDTALANRLH